MCAHSRRKLRLKREGARIWTAVPPPQQIRPKSDRLLVASNLAGRAPTLGSIAELLAMSPRTLQRQLAARGTDYRAVLEAVRVQIASAVLDAPRPPRLAKLAYDLGLSESSAACRFLNKKVRASSARQRDHLL